LVSLAILYACSAFFGPHDLQYSVWDFGAAVWICCALLRVLSQFFYYWELDADCLCVRYFWYKKEVAWEEVTHVGGLNQQPSSGLLEVDYARPAPMSDRGHILASPEDRDRFIRTLRKFAPQATFEV